MTYIQKRWNKFGAKKVNYGGSIYHSKKEAAYAAELDLRKRAGDILEWERQVKLSLDVNNYHITNYFIDFKVVHKGGLLEFIEIKGYETPEWKLKWKLWEALSQTMYPGCQLTVIK